MRWGCRVIGMWTVIAGIVSIGSGGAVAASVHALPPMPAYLGTESTSRHALLVDSTAKSSLPRRLVARAAREMDRLPPLSARGTIRMRSGRKRTFLRVTGACDASAVPARDRTTNGVGLNYLKAQGHMWGRLWNVPFDTRYILIGNQRRLQIWERSAKTHNRWKSNTTEGEGLPIMDMCSILFMSSGGVPTNTPAVYTNLGRADIGGTITRHVYMTVNPPGEHWRYDWFIDARSFRVARSVTTVRGGGGLSVSSYTYSRFGAPLRILPPGH